MMMSLCIALELNSCQHVYIFRLSGIDNFELCVQDQEMGPCIADFC